MRRYIHKVSELIGILCYHYHMWILSKEQLRYDIENLQYENKALHDRLCRMHEEYSNFRRRTIRAMSLRIVDDIDK